MGKRSERAWRRRNDEQREAVHLARARRAAEAVGVDLPTTLPSKYTRKGAKVRRQVAALTELSEEVLAREAERRRQQALRLAEAQAEAAKAREAEPPAPGTMAVRFQSTAAPPRPRPRSPALRTMMAMALLGLSAGAGPRDPDQR
jgi:hypothetical protein